ncbi:Hypothetical protein Nlim_1648 [Candidatus Nitrosarchaeum limnium SFB1]|uniref:Uncharacterized protein n=1 Tax=Candidatus Nitrosarchaeum limnium SFB1 TaxID=886738 RepID=F3KMA1_9ARCH|nr:Hypothetical protein Nlim_1648 [Candidatus Nitrosarchaeum limnium SFB1]
MLIWYLSLPNTICFRHFIICRKYTKKNQGMPQITNQCLIFDHVLLYHESNQLTNKAT